MKKKILRALFGVIFLVAFMLPSCELIQDCGTCQMVTESSDGSISYGTPLVFCGDSYQDKLNSTPTTVLGTTTYWDCD